MLPVSNLDGTLPILFPTLAPASTPATERDTDSGRVPDPPISPGAG